MNIPDKSMLRRYGSIKKIICLLVIILNATILVSAATIPDSGEQLRYRVMYKWGLINKKAGEVTITANPVATDRTFSATITGASAPWADKFYTVRDTLCGKISAKDFAPLTYEKIAHEGGRYSRDILKYTKFSQGDSVKASTERFLRKKRNGPVEHLEGELRAAGFTLDMLSSFYYMRFLDYPRMAVGDSKSMNIFSGKRKEVLKITYRGVRSIEIDGVQHRCFFITFSFTSEGKTKSSDDLYAWIEDTPARIPLKMEGDLPVGTIKCFYMP